MLDNEAGSKRPGVLVLAQAYLWSTVCLCRLLLYTTFLFFRENGRTFITGKGKYLPIQLRAYAKTAARIANYDLGKTAFLHQPAPNVPVHTLDGGGDVIGLLDDQQRTNRPLVLYFGSCS